MSLLWKEHIVPQESLGLWCQGGDLSRSKAEPPSGFQIRPGFEFEEDLINQIRWTLARKQLANR